jgi:uncharacterized protein Usg
MPDHRHLIQLFAWQFMDLAPRFPRVHEFLNYWKDNIEAPIQEIQLAHVKLTGNKFVNGKELINW